jgi:hypothetical protein
MEVDTSTCDKFIKAYKKLAEALLLKAKPHRYSSLNYSDWQDYYSEWQVVWALPHMAESCQLESKTFDFHLKMLTSIKPNDKKYPTVCHALVSMPLRQLAYGDAKDAKLKAYSMIVSNFLKYCSNMPSTVPSPIQTDNWPSVYQFEGGETYIPMFRKK